MLNSEGGVVIHNFSFLSRWTLIWQHVLQLNALISNVIHKQNATLHDPWGESKDPVPSLQPCKVWACVGRPASTGHVCTTSKYNICDKNTFIQKGLDRLEKKADGSLVEFNTANTKSCTWDGITLCSSTAWGPTAAVTTALKSSFLEITKILLGKAWATSASSEDGPAVSRSQTSYLPTKIFQGIQPLTFPRAPSMEEAS